MKDDANLVIRGLISKLYEADLISEGCYASMLNFLFDDRTDYDQLSEDLTQAIKRVEFYKLVERIERGEKLISTEKDKHKRAGYVKFLKTLTDRLEKEIT